MAVISPQEQPRVTVQVPVPTPVQPTNYAPAFQSPPQQQVVQQTQVMPNAAYQQAFAPQPQPQPMPVQTAPQPAPQQPQEEDYFTPKKYSGPVAFIFPHAAAKRPRYRPKQMQRLAEAVKRLACGERPVRKAFGSNDHSSFIKSIVENPSDTTRPLVYADWMEENGDHGAAEVIRRHVGEHGSRAAFSDQRYIGGRYGAYLHKLPEHTPFVDLYTTLPYPDGEKKYVVGVSHPDKSLPYTPDRYIGFYTTGTAEDAHRLVSGMPGVHNADMAKEELESKHPYLKKEA